jgi:hypothetical protein
MALRAFPNYGLASADITSRIEIKSTNTKSVSEATKSVITITMVQISSCISSAASKSLALINPNLSGVFDSIRNDRNNNSNASMMPNTITSTAAHEVPTKRRRSLLEGLLFVAALSLISTPAHAFTPDLGVGAHVPFNMQASASSVEAELFPASFSFRNAVSRTTARESAVLVEWERMSELERRIEDGINYEHDVDMSDSNFVAGRNYHQNAAAGRKAKGIKKNEKRGVFCGYRTTQDEIDRLKSADPNARS